MNAKVRLFRKREWDEAGERKVDWENVLRRERWDYHSLRENRTDFHVTPGTYKIILSGKELMLESGNFELSGRQSIRVMFDVVQGRCKVE